MGQRNTLINNMGKDIVIRARKFRDNRLLNRKQMVVDVFHPNADGYSKKDLTEHIAARYRVDAEAVTTFGFHTKFGGGKSSGFALIYDNKDSLMKFEKKFRLRRLKYVAEKDTSKTRKIKKEIKIKRKKLRGKEKANAGAGKKK